MIERDTSGAPVAPFDYGSIKRAFGGVYMANNGYDRARGTAAIANGKADLIAFGKPFVSNPGLVARYLLNAPLAEPDRDTFLRRHRQRLYRLSGVGRAGRGCIISSAQNFNLSSRESAAPQVTLQHDAGFPLAA